MSLLNVRNLCYLIERIKRIRDFRLASQKEKTREDANIPTLFQEIRQPDTEYVLVPRVSSENREYIPIGFIQPDVICGDQNLMIPRATLYEFGVLTSSTHMAWMRTVAGRLEMRYRYSAQIVYNNFPWPEKTPESVARIEKVAQGVLDTRANYPDRSYADLYDPLFMPPDLRKAHQILDKEVFRSYGKDSTSWPTESAIVSTLMQLYLTHR